MVTREKLLEEIERLQRENKDMKGTVERVVFEFSRLADQNGKLNQRISAVVPKILSMNEELKTKTRLFWIAVSVCVIETLAVLMLILGG